MISNDKKRHLFKTITWRISATVITILTAWLISADITLALNIGLVEVFLKMVAYYTHERIWFTKFRFPKQIVKSKNVHPKELGTPKEKRFEQLKQKPLTIWLTGLSGSGKSSISEELDELLFEHGYKTFILDGDNVRWGLNADLGFKKSEREENIRRIAETAKLFNDSGIIILTAFISPYKKLREKAKNIIGQSNFIEVYVNATVETCMDRDVKGLYVLALKGKIKDFTGVSAPYEKPTNNFIEVDGNIDGQENIQTQAKKIFDIIESKIK